MRNPVKTHHVYRLRVQGFVEQCPLSPYLFLLVMHRIFEQVSVVKQQAVFSRANQAFAPLEVPGIEFSEVLFADDTLIFAANKTSTEALLWAIEAISSEYGLHLNRTKCVALSTGEGECINFISGDEVPVDKKAEYLVVSMNAKADPAIEVNRRFANARYTWTKLRTFWTQGELSFRDKLLIYDALIGSKLTYGLHVLPLREDLMSKLDAFFYRGLRQLLQVPSTFIDQKYSNAYLIELAEERFNTNPNIEPKRIAPVSERIIKRSIEELGEIYRLPDTDIRKKVTLIGPDLSANLPNSNRTGRPRVHWTLSTMERAWTHLDLFKHLTPPTDIPFDHENIDHLAVLRIRQKNTNSNDTRTCKQRVGGDGERKHNEPNSTMG